MNERPALQLHAVPRNMKYVDSVQFQERTRSVPETFGKLTFYCAVLYFLHSDLISGHK